VDSKRPRRASTAGDAPKPGGLVFAAIAPHGGLVIAEACEPGEAHLALSTRKGMERLGRLFAATRPEVVVVATPHNVHVAGALGVIVAGRVAGHLAGAPPSVALDLPSDAALAWQMLAALADAGIPSVAVSFGGNDPESAVAPMDWGVLIPVWFMGGRRRPPVPVVVVTPARDLSAEEHVRAGEAIARASVASGRRVAFIASADHGHAHLAHGPYGFDRGAREYDDLVADLVRRDELHRLAEIPPDLIERAKADSWWQMLILHGATRHGWRGRLISYEVPTYFGMMTAAYTPDPSRGTSSRPGTRTLHRTPAR
jgi:aromatic ring-opening dioxygenase LigB subunit